MGSGEVEDESDTQRAWNERCIAREERGRGGGEREAISATSTRFGREPALPNWD